MTSLIESIASLPASERTELISSLSEDQLKALSNDWRSWARPEQMAPDGQWQTWLIRAGRGFGKTRSGAEWVKERVESGLATRIALVGQTPADVRDIMIQGESGFLNIYPDGQAPKYEPSKRRLTWPNGAFALAFSSWRPDLLRGPQFDTAWCDEVGSWKYSTETWDNLQLSLRLGPDPRCVVTTTPRPIEVLRKLIADPHCVQTTGSTYANRGNLPPAFFERIVATYAGTQRGRQEIEGELLDEVEGALWKRAWIEATRSQGELPDLVRVAVGVDPAGTAKDTSDETGIVVAGIDAMQHIWILADGSGRYSPDGWATRAIELNDRFEANNIVGESNFGGDMVGHTIRTTATKLKRSIAFKGVHASRGKRIRAEPVAALYEQGLVHHWGSFPALEDQLCNWDAYAGEKSPDRLDAMVWAVTAIMGRTGGIGLYT